jgi:hypothetical protein
VRNVQRYLAYVRDEARTRFEAGMDDVAAADGIDLSDFRDWATRSRSPVNVAMAAGIWRWRCRSRCFPGVSVLPRTRTNRPALTAAAKR